jgi:DNA gyrase subunit A
VQKRGGQGVITIKDAPDRGDLVGVTSVRGNHELMLMSQDGTVIRVPVESVRCTGRNTMGVRVMNLRGADKVSSMARLVSGNGGGDGIDSSVATGEAGSDLSGMDGLELTAVDDLEIEEGLEEGFDGEDGDDLGVEVDLN